MFRGYSRSRETKISILAPRFARFLYGATDPNKIFRLDKFVHELISLWQYQLLKSFYVSSLSYK